MDFYIVSLRMENWNVLKDTGFTLIGFSSRHKKVKNMKPGDKIILYLGSRVSCFVGILEVLEQVYYDNDLIWDEVFPNRIKTTPMVILDTDNYIKVSEIKDKLGFVNKDTRNYGAYFQHALRQINESDYNYILSLMNENK